ncbi:Asp23/Gls24 family envelope stress response protein [Streptomyces sp. TG1A-8]|uniref:Asp23/Gls24 family envelope stress response protein n=1 Tax=Streptomyces sp. TG1A-8 TaxID=3051385 RepID=UPI00265BC9EA|nr:Asp23/Gls24 family envelope stress response protein [Streptomyces sp. TG1A-8]MDO0926648.1 Asp23/Gls24 family envelope stress response protein [Streptomyces sp. TG1A-8]
MTTARPGPAPGTGPGPPAPTALPPPAERGATVIPDRVVARIAAQAARTAQSRRAALPSGRDGEAGPGASAAVRGGSVRLHLSMDLPYPTDLPGTCERIRRDVAERVARLTGLEVGEVTLTVRRLVTVAGAKRGRVR